MPSVVNVRTILLDRCEGVDELAGALPADEQECARRYLRRKDRERFVIARTLIRHVCAAYSGLEPRAVPLRRSSLGKPYLALEGWTRKQLIEFNVSHSGNCVILAWTEGGPVGVDVEAVEPFCHTSFNRNREVCIFSRRMRGLSLSKARGLCSDVLSHLGPKRGDPKGGGLRSRRSIAVFFRRISEPSWHSLAWRDSVSFQRSHLEYF